MRTAVILATRDRAGLLEQALRSVVAQRFDGGFEVVVADNGTTGDTAGAVARAAKAGPVTVRYLKVPEPGKAHAVNAAVRTVDAEVLAFLDDDEVADPYWLASLHSGLERHRDAAAVGGPYLPWLPDVSSYWRRALLSPYLVDQGPVDRPAEWLAGGNLAVLRSAWLEAGEADPGFEVGEDVQLCRSLAAAGHGVYWIPAAVVFHRLHGDRLTLRGWRRQVTQHGRAMALTVSRGAERESIRRWSRVRWNAVAQSPYAVMLEGVGGVFRQLDVFLRHTVAIRFLRQRLATTDGCAGRGATAG